MNDKIQEVKGIIIIYLKHYVSHMYTWKLTNITAFNSHIYMEITYITAFNFTAHVPS